MLCPYPAPLPSPEDTYFAWPYLELSDQTVQEAEGRELYFDIKVNNFIFFFPHKLNC